MEERRSEGSDPGNRTGPAPRSTTRALASTVTRNGYVPLDTASAVLRTCHRDFGHNDKPACGLRSQRHVGEVAPRRHRPKGFGPEDKLRNFGSADGPGFGQGHAKTSVAANWTGFGLTRFSE
ncbi:MAG: hypothetical protein GY788_24655 [bacterium]|nr:hypothetical protein [bacterium]